MRDPTDNSLRYNKGMTFIYILLYILSYIYRPIYHLEEQGYASNTGTRQPRRHREAVAQHGSVLLVGVEGVLFPIKHTRYEGADVAKDEVLRFPRRCKGDAGEGVH